jgi:hypothetical protein
MTELQEPRPKAVLDAIAETVKNLPDIRAAKVLHGRFNLDDLKRQSTATPAAFIQQPHLKPVKRANGETLAVTEYGVLVAFSNSHDPWEIALTIFETVDRNHFGFRNMDLPTKLAITPVIDPSQGARSGMGLIAITWEQQFTIKPKPDRKPGETTIEFDNQEYVLNSEANQ